MHFPLLPNRQSTEDDNANLVNSWLPCGIKFYRHLSTVIDLESVQTFMVAAPRYPSELEITIKGKEVKKILLACHEAVANFQLPKLLKTQDVDLAFVLDVCLLYSQNTKVRRLIHDLLNSDKKLAHSSIGFLEKDLFKALRIGGESEEFVLETLLTATCIVDCMPSTVFSSISIGETKQLLHSGST